MRLSVGARLGPYEIVSPLGAGGMGEVYRARDTRLERTVAIKVVPAHLSSSPEARKRLEREARAISRLSHPHVCALFDVGQDGETDFLVMELLEGETLAARLEKGPLPLASVLALGAQMADALHAAHQHGIVHRDLKPSNVMLTAAGVKVLDFGLARPARGLLPGAESSEELTLSSPLTGHGAVVGTLPYMSPEQVEGRPADARSDVFALGAVLFQMATGRRAFAGASPAAVASAILAADPPPLASLRPSSPPGLDPLIGTCLARDPDRRWQSARDVSLQLEAMGAAASVPPVKARPHLLAWVLAALAAAVAFVAGLRARETQGPALSPVRFTIPLPEGNASLGSIANVATALSPDGSQLAFVARSHDVRSRLWLRSLAALEPQPLEGTEGAISAFWSPDGRSLAFFADGKLKRLDPPDGAVVPLCDVKWRNGAFGTWGRDGQILYAPIEGEAIYRVSAAGGTPTVELATDSTPGSPRLNWPLFLPDGRRFLYLARQIDRGGRLMLAEPGQAPREVLSVLSNVAYVDPGYLVFVREGALLGQRFDPATGRVSGEPISIVGSVSYRLTTSRAEFTASHNGTIVYQSGLSTSRLVWVDRKGRELGEAAPASGISRVRLSPDGGRAVFDRIDERNGTSDIWALEVERGAEARLTSSPGSEFNPVWLPDVNGVVFSAPRGGPPHLFRRDLVTGVEAELLPAGPVQAAEDVSPDGRFLVFSQRGERGDADAWILPLSAEGPPSPLLSSSAEEWGVRFSENGRFVAFSSNESGRPEVYVAPFPNAVVRTQVSSSGGQAARWNHKRREIVYLSPDRQIVSVPVLTAPALKIGAPTVLFALKDGEEWTDFDASPDGRRFLATVPVTIASEQPYTVIVNWPAGIGPGY